MFLRFASLALLLALCVGPALADDEPPQPGSLGIGDEAPPIDVAHWIKGVSMDRRGRFEPVTTFEPGHVYVLEFWATWCGPCLMGMPHLSEMQERFADRAVTIIGISDESLPKVYDFLWKEWPRDGKLQNDRTRYTLTTDPDRSVHRDYMEAADQHGIPTAFIVGKTGQVEWIGHPMQMDEPLEAVVNDTWDRETFRAQWVEQEKVKAAMREARPRLALATRAEDWPQVVSILDGLLEVVPGNLGLKMQKLTVLLTKMDDAERAYAFADEVVKEAWDDARMLNQLAWTVVDDASVKHRDLTFARKVAERANELTASKDAAILDTLARVHYEQGSLVEAIRWQSTAVAAAPEGDLKTQLVAVLKKYVGELAEATFAPAPPEPPEGLPDEE